jgi:hypothetical protein
MKSTPISLKRRFRSTSFVLSVLLISMLHVPIAFSRPVINNRMSLHPEFFKSVDLSNLSNLETLDLGAKGLSKETFDKAHAGWQKLATAGKLADPSIISIVDFTRSSTEKRLFILDLQNNRILFHTLVAHGKNTGERWAKSFSNTMSSLKSSLGFFVTGSTYMGGNGYSLKLNGLERGINDMANSRAIVMHGADYVSQAFINARGFLGRSWGCPAIPENEAQPIINTIKGGTCLFIYSRDKYYLSHSSLINS